MRKAFLIARIFAIPTVLICLIIFYDLSKPSHQETASVVNKYITHNTRGGGTVKNLVVGNGKDVRDFWVSSDFYNSCSIGDAVELYVSPIFKKCQNISLVRDGKIIG
jgi:hypothetical protein